MTNSLPSPARHLAEFGKRYPRAWRQVDETRANRGRDLPWPEWCFLPLAGAYAIASGGGTNRLSPKDVTQASILGALAPWRVTQGIYRFDPDVFAAVWETPIEGDLPVDLLYRLPEWCVYVETPGRGVFYWPLHGFFAHLEWDANTGRAELRLVLDTAEGLTTRRAGPRPHIRRAHWHSFWTGPRKDPSERTLALRWLPPIPVAVADAGELVPAIRNVP